MWIIWNEENHSYGRYHYEEKDFFSSVNLRQVEVARQNSREKLVNKQTKTAPGICIKIPLSQWLTTKLYTHTIKPHEVR